MKVIDNLVIGNLVEGVSLSMLGVLDTETTIHISEEQACEASLFLPRILSDAGLFQSSSQIKQIHKVREKSTKFPDPDERILWRTLDHPELSHFKVGKRVFWLIVGDLDSFKK